MDFCEDRSAINRSMAWLPLCALISLCACSPLARSRLTSTTVASRLASPSAVAFPTPELAPVIRHIFPCIDEFMIGITLVLSKFSALDQLDEALFQFMGARPRFTIADSQVIDLHHGCNLFRGRRNKRFFGQAQFVQ